MTTGLGPAGFSMGRVIARLFGVLGRNLATFLLLSVLLVGLPEAVLGFLRYSALAPITAGGPAAMLSRFFSPAQVGLGVLTFLVTVAANAVLQAAVIHGAVSDLNGRRAALGECLATGLRFFLPLLAIGIIAAVGCFFGFLIFIVPGVLLALAWSVAGPAEVMERRGVLGALGRSLELTRGHRWAILGLAVLLFIVQIMVQMVLGALLGAGFGFSAAAGSFAGGAADRLQGVMILPMVTALIVRTLLASVATAGLASIYFELRQAKEGVGAEELAAVFD